MLKELLNQNVISIHKISHGFDSFFRNTETSSSDDLTSKWESINHSTEEHPSKAPNIKISNSSISKDNSTQRDFQSPCCLNRTEAKSLIEIETQTLHTMTENETINTKKHSNTAPWKQAWYSRGAHHQGHAWKVKAQSSALKSYFDSELSSLNNKFDTFFEYVNTILSFITEPRERPRIESSNINFLQTRQ